MKRVFHGWWMAGAGCAMQFVQSCMLQQAFGAYFAILRDDRGWSKTELSGAAALHQMESAILGPVLGWFLDRFGPQWVIRIGVLLFGAGFMLLSQIDSLLAFYACFLLTATGASLCGFFPLNFVLIHWFEKKRARALFSMQFGMAAGGLAVPAVAWALATYGWRVTAFASGVAIIVICLPISFVFKRRPEDVGQRVDGEAHPTASVMELQRQEPGDGTRDFTAREALRTSAFWLLAAGHAFALFVVVAVNTHAITHMKEGLGYSLEGAAGIMAVMTASQLLGVILGGLTGDRYDKRILSAWCMVGHMLGLLCLTYAVNTFMLVLYALFHGVAWGMRGPFMQALRADYFGTRAIGMILGLSFMIIVVGQVGGPMFAGIMADATGNYRAGFTVLALLAGLGSVFFLVARRPARPRA